MSLLSQVIWVREFAKITQNKVRNMQPKCIISKVPHRYVHWKRCSVICSGLSRGAQLLKDGNGDGDEELDDGWEDEVAEVRVIPKHVLLCFVIVDNLSWLIDCDVDHCLQMLKNEE